MKNWEQNLVSVRSTIKQALEQLNTIGVASTVLVAVDDDNKLQGSLTDGDIRRGLLKNAGLEDKVGLIMNAGCVYLKKNSLGRESISAIKAKGIFIVPLVDDKGRVIDILDLNQYRVVTPVDAVLMAGGKGERLLPLTKDTPKPLLEVGGKPIIEYNIDRLVQFGIENIHISINYLGDKIESCFKDGSDKGVRINYLREKEPLGTMGSITIGMPYEHDTILLMNSDLLTNIDFGDFYDEFKQTGADMAVASIAHHVDLPYAILELDEDAVSSLREKPRYTYFANAGIYLIKSELLGCIPENGFYNATDMMERVIADGKKLIHFPIRGYWLDIGRMSDFQRAQEDIKHLNWA